MLYHLLYPLHDQISVFNLFKYVTFRAAGGMGTAILITFLIGRPLINWLRVLRFGQVVRTEGPESHLKKAGTPTMGGIGILVAILVSTLLWANLRNRYMWVLMLATAGLGLIGLKDDWKKLKTRRGISAKEKFGAQIVLVGALMAFLYWWPADGFTTSVVIPYFQDLLPRQAGVATSLYSNALKVGGLVGFSAFGLLAIELGNTGLFLLCAGLSATTLVIVAFTRARPR